MTDTHTHTHKYLRAVANRHERTTVKVGLGVSPAQELAPDLGRTHRRGKKGGSQQPPCYWRRLADHNKSDHNLLKPWPHDAEATPDPTSCSKGVRHRAPP